MKFIDKAWELQYKIDKRIEEIKQGKWKKEPKKNNPERKLPSYEKVCKARVVMAALVVAICIPGPIIIFLMAWDTFWGRLIMIFCQVLMILFICFFLSVDWAIEQRFGGECSWFFPLGDCANG